MNGAGVRQHAGQRTGGRRNAHLERRTRPQQHLDGLVGACKTALAAGSLPATGGLRPQVMATISYQDLLNRLETTATPGPRYTTTTTPAPGPPAADHPAPTAGHPASTADDQPGSPAGALPGTGRHRDRHRNVHLHRARHPRHHPQNRLRRRHHPRPSRQRRPHPRHRPHHPHLPAPHPQSHHRPRPRLRLPQLHHPRPLVRSPPHHLLVTRRTHQHRQRHPPVLPSPPPHPQRTMDHPHANRHPLVHPATPHRPPTKTPPQPPTPKLTTKPPGTHARPRTQQTAGHQRGAHVCKAQGSGIDPRAPISTALYRRSALINAAPGPSRSPGAAV